VALEAICLRAMAKAPNDRYQSAAELAAALKAYASDPVDRRSLRRGFLISVTAVVVLVLVATVLAWPWLRERFNTPQTLEPPPPHLATALMAIQQQIDAGISDDPHDLQLESLRFRLLSYLGNYPRTTETNKAARLLSAIPWPMGSVQVSREAGIRRIHWHALPTGVAFSDKVTADLPKNLAGGMHVVVRAQIDPVQYEHRYEFLVEPRDGIAVQIVSLTDQFFPFMEATWEAPDLRYASNTESCDGKGWLLHSVDSLPDRPNNWMRLRVVADSNSPNRLHGEYLLHVWHLERSKPP
jgi:hypothetical protein